MSTTRRQDHVQRAVPQTTQCRKDEYVLVTPVSQATTQETDVCVLSILTPGVQGRGEPHALVPPCFQPQRSTNSESLHLLGYTKSGGGGGEGHADIKFCPRT